MRGIFYRTVPGVGLGLIFALIRVLPFFLPIFIPGPLKDAAEIINAPALWLAHLWSDGAGLPSGGELGRELLLPAALIVGQWTFIGFALAWWWCHKTQQSRNKQEEHVPAAK